MEVLHDDIWELIATHLSDEDLLSLSFTCSGLSILCRPWLLQRLATTLSLSLVLHLRQRSSVVPFVDRLTEQLEENSYEYSQISFRLLFFSMHSESLNLNKKLKEIQQLNDTLHKSLYELVEDLLWTGPDLLHLVFKNSNLISHAEDWLMPRLIKLIQLDSSQISMEALITASSNTPIANIIGIALYEIGAPLEFLRQLNPQANYVITLNKLKQGKPLKLGRDVFNESTQDYLEGFFPEARARRRYLMRNQAFFEETYPSILKEYGFFD